MKPYSPKNWLVLLFIIIVVISDGSGQRRNCRVGRSHGKGRGRGRWRESAGSCVFLHRCSYAMQQLNRGNYPQICGFSGRNPEPIVCCPRNNNNQHHHHQHQNSHNRGDDVLNRPNLPELPSETPEPSEPSSPPEISYPPDPPEPPTVSETSSSLPIELPPSGIKSKEKCEEYATKVPEPKLKFKTFVVGGVRASASEFPHMAALGFGEENDVQWLCGGTLISDQYVLTAAHCIYSPQVGNVKYVRLGDLNLKNTTDDAQPQDFQAAESFVNPDYAPPSQYNDIALIKLDRPIEFTKYVKPACLQTEFDLPQDSTPIATGWGKLAYAGDSSENLMKVDLSYYTPEQCKKTYTNVPQRQLAEGIDDETQICAGGVDESKDTCQGDSGGPLQIKSPDNPKQFFVIGVTSFGKACGIVNTPGVYTRVSSYIPWIEEIAFAGGA